MAEVTIRHKAVKKRYVYRLDVEYPPEAADHYWVPETWDEGYPFSWPRERVFLSLTGALHLADRLTRYGCKVRIRRSEPVSWLNGKVVREMGGDEWD